MAWISRRVSTGGRWMACSVGCSSGIRPVDIMKSYTAGPRPTIVGPWPVPRPRAPWQGEQCSSYTEEPSVARDPAICASVDAGGAAGAAPLGRNRNAPGTMSSTTTIRYARANLEGLIRPGLSLPRSSNDEDGREQADPHDVDEVPVVRRHLHARVLLRRVRAGRCAAQDDEHDDQPGEHVQPVEAGHR